MRTSNSYTNRSSNDAMQFPTREEIDLQVSKAKRARSAYLQHLVVNAFAALDRRSHHTSPATN